MNSETELDINDLSKQEWKVLILLQNNPVLTLKHISDMLGGTRDAEKAVTHLTSINAITEGPRYSLTEYGSELLAKRKPLSDIEGFTAVLYARVSTDDKGQTNETQIREMKAWCESKGVIIDSIYQDEMTGTTLQRPAFSQAVVRIITPPYKINILLAYDRSRLTRDEKLEDIAAMISPSGCKVRFVSMDMDDSTFAGKIVNTVVSSFDKEENDIRRKKTKEGMHTRRLNGKHIGRPRGFCIAEAHDAMRDGEVNENTRYVTVKTIFEFVEQGKSTTEIGRIFYVDAATIRRALRKAGYWEEYQKLKHPENYAGNGATQGCSDTRVENSGKNSDTRVGSE